MSGSHACGYAPQKQCPSLERCKRPNNDRPGIDSDVLRWFPGGCEAVILLYMFLFHLHRLISSAPLHRASLYGCDALGMYSNVLKMSSSIGSWIASNLFIELCQATGPFPSASEVLHLGDTCMSLHSKLLLLQSGVNTSAVLPGERPLYFI